MNIRDLSQKGNAPESSDVSRQMFELLSNPRYELMPFESFEEQVSHVPKGKTITITASPNKDIEATVSRAVTLPERGYEVVPHIAARSVRDENHLRAIVTRLNDAGVSDIFVPGGDLDEPVGDFESAFELLSTMKSIGLQFPDVGITGYPEGHPFLSNETLFESMRKKAPFATYIVTQYCFDHGSVIDWIDEVRSQGIELPVYIGVSGVMRYQKLLEISRRVGVGDSIRFLHKTTGITGFLRQLLGSRGTYTPERLIRGLALYSNDQYYNIEGLHIYTFNQVADTEDWRKKLLDKI